MKFVWFNWYTTNVFCKSKYCKLTFSRNAAICWSKYCYCLSGHLNLTFFLVIFLRADVLWEKLQIKSALFCITHKKLTNSFLFCGCMTYSRASTLDGSGRTPSAPYVIPQNEIVLQPNWHVLWFKVRPSLDIGCIASSITFIFTLWLFLATIKSSCMRCPFLIWEENLYSILFVQVLSQLENVCI